MQNYYLGIDVGGSKTNALVADEHGRAVGFGAAGPGNHEVVGYDGLANAMNTAAQQAMLQAGITPAQIGGAGFGLGGFDWPSELPETLEAIRALGLDCPLGVVNDAMIGLIAGAERGWGIGVVSGSGCNCYGRNRQGKIGNVTGMGLWMGEGAGASELLGETVRRLSQVWSLRAPQTRLAAAFCELYGVPDLGALIEGIAQERISYYHRAAAPLIFQVAAEGDAVAQDLVRWAGESLADLAIGVIRQIGIQHETFETVLIGSMFKNGEALIAPFRAALHAFAPGAQLKRLSVPPVVGGALLGMERGGLDITALRPALVSSTAAFLTLEEEAEG